MSKIENFDNLSEEKKKLALEQLKTVNMNNESSSFFKENGYIKIENFIPKETANLLYFHVKNNVKRLAYLEQKDLLDSNERQNYYGVWGDEQAPGKFSRYGDPIFDDLCEKSTSIVSDMTGVELVPTYTYHRLYTYGSVLEKHIYRKSCEVSTTLCLGYDISNLKDKNYNWAMYVSNKNNNNVPVYLNPGDMLVYRGCDLEHWREKFEGVHHAQVFLHYNEKDGFHNNKFDSRPLMGLSNKFINRTKNELWDE